MGGVSELSGDSVSAVLTASSPSYVFSCPDLMAQSTLLQGGSGQCRDFERHCP
jgi:hypothetical protein